MKGLRRLYIPQMRVVSVNLTETYPIAFLVRIELILLEIAVNSSYYFTFV